MLIHEISDPRLQQIFVTDVRVDRELAFADIYVSAIEGFDKGLGHRMDFFLKRGLLGRFLSKSCGGR